MKNFYFEKFWFRKVGASILLLGCSLITNGAQPTPTSKSDDLPAVANIALGRDILRYPECNSSLAEDKTCRFNEDAKTGKASISWRPNFPKWAASAAMVSLTNKKITDVYAITKGFEVQRELYQELVARFGKPTRFKESTVQNRMGAVFPKIEASWILSWGIVDFQGITDSIDAGVLTGSLSGTSSNVIIAAREAQDLAAEKITKPNEDDSEAVLGLFDTYREAKIEKGTFESETEYSQRLNQFGGRLFSIVVPLNYGDTTKNRSYDYDHDNQKLTIAFKGHETVNDAEIIRDSSYSNGKGQYPAYVVSRSYSDSACRYPRRSLALLNVEKNLPASPEKLTINAPPSVAQELVSRLKIILNGLTFMDPRMKGFVLSSSGNSTASTLSCKTQSHLFITGLLISAQLFDPVTRTIYGTYAPNQLLYQTLPTGGDKTFLGVVASPVSRAFSNLTGQDPSVGAIVGAVYQGSAAMKIGLRSGDVIISIGGKSVPATKDGLPAIVSTFAKGETASAVILREGREITIPVTF